MAQTGYTPILIYSSTTASQVPSASNLTNSTLGSELAINITDGKLFYKDNGGSVQVIGWKTVPTSAGGTGLTSYTAGDTLYYATGTTLSKLAIGASKTIMTSSGSAPQWSTSLDTTQGGTGVTSYTAGDLPYYATGTTLSKLGIGAANTVLTSSGTAPQWSSSLTLASSATATAFIPSGSTVPTNGMYLSASNTVAWATNSSYRALISSSGLAINTTTQNAQLTVLSQLSNTGVPSAGNTTAWLMNDPGSVVANAGGALTFAARTRASPNEIQPMAGFKGAKLNANDDEIAGYLAFYTADNTTRGLLERAKIDNLGNYIPSAANKGVNFTANSAAAGMTSQLLNWYEEGTWTPTLYGTGGSAGTYAATASGTYTRVGRLVHVMGSVSISNKGSWSGTVQVDAPFTPSGQSGTGAVRSQLNTFDGTLVCEWSTSGSALRFNVTKTGTGQVTLQWTDLVTSGYLQFSLTYFV